MVWLMSDKTPLRQWSEGWKESVFCCQRGSRCVNEVCCLCIWGGGSPYHYQFMCLCTSTALYVLYTLKTVFRILLRFVSFRSFRLLRRIRREREIKKKTEKKENKTFAIMKIWEKLNDGLMTDNMVHVHLPTDLSTCWHIVHARQTPLW